MPIELSIVVPTRNRRALLGEALNSIWALTLNGTVEVIVADDGSTDGTDEFCKQQSRMGFPDGRMKLVYSATLVSCGAQVARNRGMALARGRWIMFLDSDDVIVPAGVAKLVGCLQGDPSLDYAFGKIIRTDDQLKPLAGRAAEGVPFADCPREIAGWHWAIHGAIYRRTFLEKVGRWNEALSGSQDWEYQARVKLSGRRGQFVDTLVGYWRHHGGSRVGTQTFRPDYVRSVMLACDVITTLARQAGRCDRQLERRLAKKLILHALEWGANGHPNERRQCLAQAAQTVPRDRLYLTLIQGFQCSPRFLNAWLWKKITTKTKRLKTEKLKG